MTLKTVAQTLDAQIVCNKEMEDKDVLSACGSDLMSDVMAFVKEQVLLLTGLINIQVMDYKPHELDAVGFVRKTAHTEMIDITGAELSSLQKLLMLISCDSCMKQA